MADLRFYTSWRGHWKRKLLRWRHGADGVLAIEDLWSYCASERKNGSLVGMSNKAIGIELGYEGDVDELIATLTDPEVRLLDGTAGALHVHNWEKRQPYLAAADQRAKSAKISAAIRWHKEGKHAEPYPNCPLCDPHATRTERDANRMQGDAIRISKHADRMKNDAPSPSPYPTPNPTPDPAGSIVDIGPVEEAFVDAGLGSIRATLRAKVRAVLPVTRSELDDAIEKTRRDADKPNPGYAITLLGKASKTPEPLPAPIQSSAYDAWRAKKESK